MNKDEWNKYFGHIKEEDLRHHEPNKLKKPIIIFLGFFMIITFFIAFAANGTIQTYLTNQMVSTTIEENQATSNSITLIFENKTYENLLDVYLDNPETEVKVCLLGKIINDSYVVTDLYLPLQIKFFNSVHYTPCNLETIVALHSHPTNECLPSTTDITTMKAYRIFNPNVLGIVMCNLDKLAFY